jgi:hypothetical protein
MNASRSWTCQLQAVLLLCPNIRLYSTDAMPANCSSPPASSMPKLCPSEPPVQRTCDCLTQTLCCHGCGDQCGYAIVTPVGLSLLLCRAIAHVAPSVFKVLVHRYTFAKWREWTSLRLPPERNLRNGAAICARRTRYHTGTPKPAICDSRR